MTLLQIVLSTTNLISIGSITGIIGIVIAVNRNFNNRLEKKVDKESNKTEVKNIHARISENARRAADQTVVTEMSKKLDIIIEKLIN